MRNPVPVVLATLALAGCGAAPVGNSEQAINGDHVLGAFQWQLDRAAALPGCSGTRIAPNFVMTASHCLQQAGNTVFFYTSGPGMDTSKAAVVTNVFLPPCVDPTHSQWADCSGNFSDIAILQLDRNVTVGSAATMAWSYPGSEALGVKVGAGNHNGNPNPSRILLQETDTTSTADDSAGLFRTDHVYVDGGDSGGPFYFNQRVLGELWGQYWTEARYTAVPPHLDWILGVMRYVWPGGTPITSGKMLSGNVLDNFSGSERVCQYACEQNGGSCLGYNYDPAQVKSCVLVSSINGLQGASSSSARYALRFAVPSSTTGNPTSGVRYTHDGADSLFKRASDNHIHELFFQSTQSAWNWSDITTAAVNGPAPLASGAPAAYVRSDKFPSVVYNCSGWLCELYFNNDPYAYDNRWHWRYLSTAQTTGNPSAYTTFNGASMVTFRSGNNIVLLTPPNGVPSSSPWNSQTLAFNAVGDPMVWRRPDGVVSIVYHAVDNHVHELFSGNGVNFSEGDPQFLAAQATGFTPPPIAGNPFAYAHADGTIAIDYRGTDGNIWELFLNGSWLVGNLTSGGEAAGDPRSYVRADGTTAVVFRNGSSGFWSDISELTLTNGGWTEGDLTSFPANFQDSSFWHSAAGDPSPWVRSDGTSSVLYLDWSNQVRELTESGPNGWQGWQLSALIHDTP